jgi:pimeloyl-ACP methyl ester carboxylesterase
MLETMRLGQSGALVARGSGVAQPPILFLHGLFAASWYWDHYLRFFAERGYTGYAIDLRGRGASRAVPDIGRVSIEEFIADARDAAAALTIEGQPPIVIGHSLGGLLAQKLAELGAARAAVLLCPAPPRGIPIVSAPLMARMLKYLPALALSRPLRPSRADTDVIILNGVPPAERERHYARLVPDSARAGRQALLGAVAIDAARVRCPVYVATASDDRFVPSAVVRRIAQKYHAAVREHAGHAHFLLQEPGWDVPAADVARWLAHVLHRLEHRDERDALWSQLKSHIGDVVRLRFYDGEVVRAEIVNVDLAEHEDVIYDVIAVETRGALGAGTVTAGTTAIASLHELAAVDPVAA